MTTLLSWSTSASQKKTENRKKTRTLDELGNLNINEYTIYNDLDHLAQEIRRTWLIG